MERVAKPVAPAASGGGGGGFGPARYTQIDVHNAYWLVVVVVVAVAADTNTCGGTFLKLFGKQSVASQNEGAAAV